MRPPETIEQFRKDCEVVRQELIDSAIDEQKFSSTVDRLDAEPPNFDVKMAH